MMGKHTCFFFSFPYCRIQFSRKITPLLIQHGPHIALVPPSEDLLEMPCFDTVIANLFFNHAVRFEKALLPPQNAFKMLDWDFREFIFE